MGVGFRTVAHTHTQTMFRFEGLSLYIYRRGLWCLVVALVVWGVSICASYCIGTWMRTPAASNRRYVMDALYNCARRIYRYRRARSLLLLLQWWRTYITRGVADLNRFESNCRHQNGLFLFHPPADRSHTLLDISGWLAELIYAQYIYETKCFD